VKSVKSEALKLDILPFLPSKECLRKFHFPRIGIPINMTITKGLATVFLLIEMLAHSVTGYAFQGKTESVSVSRTRSHILAAT